MLFGKASLVFAVALAIGSIPLASAGTPNNRHHLKRQVIADTARAHFTEPDAVLFACYEYGSDCNTDPGLEKLKYQNNVQLSLCHKGEWYNDIPSGGTSRGNPTTWWGSCPSKDDKKCNDFVAKYQEDFELLGKEISKTVMDQKNCDTILYCYKPDEVNQDCFLTEDARKKMDPQPPKIGSEEPAKPADPKNPNLCDPNDAKCNVQYDLSRGSMVWPKGNF